MKPVAQIQENDDCFEAIPDVIFDLLAESISLVDSIFN